MTTTPVNHLATARAAMTPTERRLFIALADGFGYASADLVDDDDTVGAFHRAAQILASHVRDDLNDQLAELLYDAAHDDCADECTGGGRPWYDRAAARLTDPYGPLAAVANEREMQDDKWGEQNHPDGTGSRDDCFGAEITRSVCQEAADAGELTWRLVLEEETAEAYAESDPARLRAELVQVAAVAAAWIEAIDRRTGR